MSPDLIAFLRAWYDWATSGAPDKEPFNCRFGLCSNADGYGPVADELFALLGRTFPFGEQDYSIRYVNRTQHECPRRLAWVRARLVEAGEIA